MLYMQNVSHSKRYVDIKTKKGLKIKSASEKLWDILQTLLNDERSKKCKNKKKRILLAGTVRN